MTWPSRHDKGGRPPHLISLLQISRKAPTIRCGPLQTFLKNVDVVLAKAGWPDPSGNRASGSAPGASGIGTEDALADEAIPSAAHIRVSSGATSPSLGAPGFVFLGALRFSLLVRHVSVAWWLASKARFWKQDPPASAFMASLRIEASRYTKRQIEEPILSRGNTRKKTGTFLAARWPTWQPFGSQVCKPVARQLYPILVLPH